MIGSLGLFTKLWKEHTEIVEVVSKGHPKCDRCGEILAARAKFSDRTDEVGRDWARKCDRDQAEHDEEHLGERDYSEDFWLKAQDRPDLITAASMDAPTETQFDVPMQKRTAHDVVKSLEGGKKWSSKIMGLMFARYGMRVYAAREALGSGSNLSLTVLYLGLLLLVASGHTLGRMFHVLLDNTSADNKNNEMIFFLAWLVMEGAFEETCAFMMIKGHTYSRIDQSFRTMIVQMMGEAVWTISMMLAFLFKFLAPYNCLGVEELPHVWDWGNFFAPHVHQRLGGFATGQYGSGMHEIRCRKDKDGVVRVWLRKSSKASNWLPEEGGIPVFKSTPNGQPKVKEASSDVSWNKEGVEANVNAWYKYMHVNETAAAKIRAEWEARFAALPPNGDTTQLPEEAKLKWAELPKRMAATPGPREDFGTTYVSNALENPPVNPLTYHGRTAGDVAREVNSYQQFVRNNYEGEIPVFQADFLLVQPKGKELQLHRVVHDLAIEEATVKNISCTTAVYEEIPQQGCPRLFGTFVPKLNVHHDPSNKKSGGKFVRVPQLQRDDIVLYNVEVDGIRVPATQGEKAHTKLQLTRKSLEGLAIVRPSFVMPSPLPPSHADQAGIDEEDNAPGGGRARGNGRRRSRALVVSEEEEDEDDVDDDVQAVAPDGWEVVPWEPGEIITNFMVWTQLPGEAHRTWHVGVVARTLARPTVREGFTHDVCLDGTAERRGLALSAETYGEGVWNAIRNSNQEDEEVDQPANSPDTHNRPTRRRRQR